jgi:nucleoside-diphosphate-sugar epimerase
MKFIVAGALGHIGSRLIRDLPVLFPGCSIIMIDNMLTQRYCSLFNLPDGAHYKFIESDILNMELDDILGGADVVFQLAAITNAAGSFQMKEQVEHNNFNATRKIAETCAKFDLPLIHLSSTSVYGTQNEVVDEFCSADELKPQSPYAETKLKEERFLQELGRERKLRFVTLRFGTICGISPGMRFHTAVNKFCWQAVMRQPITVWRTALHQKRPYLTLSDAMSAFNFIIKSKIYDREVYNVLSDNLTVNDIILYIRSYIDDITIEYVDSKIMNQLSYEVSKKRIEGKGLNFEGKIEQSISETIRLLEKAGQRP